MKPVARYRGGFRWDGVPVEGYADEGGYDPSYANDLPPLVAITFENVGASAVDVYWLDGDFEDYYFSLEPGEILGFLGPS